MQLCHTMQFAARNVAKVELYSNSANAARNVVRNVAPCVRALSVAIQKQTINGINRILLLGLDSTRQDWDRVLGVNVIGYSNMVQACYPFMKESKSFLIFSCCKCKVYYEKRYL